MKDNDEFSKDDIKQNRELLKKSIFSKDISEEIEKDSLNLDKEGEKRIKKDKIDVDGDKRKKSDKSEKVKDEEKKRKKLEKQEQKEYQKSRNTLILIKRTFQDLANAKKFIISIIIMMIIPIIFLTFPSSLDYGAISIENASAAIAISIAYPVFFWTLGMAFVCLIGVSGAGLISEEVSSGTMLILVSKPIARMKIFLGKYLGLFLYSILLSFTGIFIIGWIAVLRYSANLDHFISLLPFLMTLFLYSLIISVIFVSITMAISSISKKPRNAALIVIFLGVISFFGMWIIKMFIASYYEQYQIYHFDLGYHLANIFVTTMEIFNAIPPVSEWQYFFALATNVYDTSTGSDPDQQIILGGFERTDYYLPIFSLLIWLAIAGLLLVYGLFSINKREIS